MSEDMDPEVIADLALRAANLRDRNRGKDADEVYNWTEPPIVASWPCRGRCGATVGVTQHAVDALTQANERLRGRGEPEIEHVTFCEACTSRLKAEAAERRARRDATMTAMIRELRAGVSPEKERDILAKLRAMHHPDVDGLARLLAERRAAAKPQRRPI